MSEPSLQRRKETRRRRGGTSSCPALLGECSRAQTRGPHHPGIRTPSARPCETTATNTHASRCSRAAVLQAPFPNRWSCFQDSFPNAQAARVEKPCPADPGGSGRCSRNRCQPHSCSSATASPARSSQVCSAKEDGVVGLHSRGLHTCEVTSAGTH